MVAAESRPVRLLAPLGSILVIEAMPNALLQAEVLPAAEYSAAQPDPLRESAPLLVDQMNTQRAEDVLRIAARASGVTINQMEHAQAWHVQPCDPTS